MSSTTPTTCPLDCPDACGVLVESDAEGRFVRLSGNPEHGWSQGVLCGKTQLYGELLAAPDRLTTPLVRARKGAELVPATWEDAIARIVERVKPLVGSDVLALSYGGSMGLVQRKFPLRMFHALGATLHDGGVCDASGTAGVEAVLGRCLGPDIDTVVDSDLLVLWGCDMARTHQHLQPKVKQLLARGVPVVAIDVWRTETIRTLEKWGGFGLIVQPGTDAALALCIARIAFEVGEVDHAFLAEQCVGADAFETHVRQRCDLETTARITGLDPKSITELAGLLMRAKTPFLKTGIGFARRRNGGMSLRAIGSMAAVMGHAARVHFESFAHFDLAEDAVIRPDLRPPDGTGAPNTPVTQVQIGRELVSGRFRAVFVWCHNPAVTLPESALVRRGLAREDLFLVVHEHFLTETAELADVVLPATMFPEHEDVYRSYGHRWMQHARPAVKAPGGTWPPSTGSSGPRSNVETFAAIGKALGLRQECWNVSATSVCKELLDASRSRLSADELARLATGAPVKPVERAHADWGTPSGKVELVSERMKALGQPPMATFVPDDWCGDTGAFVLLSCPSVQTHNSTYAHSARHAKKAGPARVHLNPRDAEALGVRAGERVTLSNPRASLTLPVALCEHTPRHAVRVDGLPPRREIPEGVGVNALVSGAVSDLGNGNVLYSTRVDVRPFK
ncbi:MAG: molybdopterin-dependent oxidoreductase [Planctomycetes bacterium]|nr:molybdopterin-dependent oxidoreductase [Planctomycetota bacterium]